MQSELEDLRTRQQEHEDLERERKRQEKEQSRQDKFQEKAQSHQERAKEKIKPSVLAVVGFSRLLQLASGTFDGDECIFILATPGGTRRNYDDSR